MRKSGEEYSGSSSPSGLDNHLQFCDTCSAAYPVQDVPNDICVAAPPLSSEENVGFIHYTFNHFSIALIFVLVNT